MQSEWQQVWPPKRFSAVTAVYQQQPHSAKTVNQVSTRHAPVKYPSWCRLRRQHLSLASTPIKWAASAQPLRLMINTEEEGKPDIPNAEIWPAPAPSNANTFTVTNQNTNESRATVTCGQNQTNHQHHLPINSSSDPINTRVTQHRIPWHHHKTTRMINNSLFDHQYPRFSPITHIWTKSFN